MSTTRIRRFVLVILLALTVGGIAAVSARADAPDVKVNSPAPGQHPYQTGTATVDTVTGHVTVDLTGGWSWPSHGKDCNTDRAGAGVAVNWLDPTDRGFHLGYFAINGGTANTTAGGPDDFGVGATGANGLNPADDVVHPTENDTGTGAVVDITNPSQFANWRGGCGVYSSDTILVNNHGTLSYTTGTVSHGNFGKVTPSSVDSGGVAFNDPTPPSTSALQGALLQHVYPSTADVTEVCAVMYDVHPAGGPNGGTASSNNGVGIPGMQSEVTAGQQAVAAGAMYSGMNNNDNSITGNKDTPAGNTCPQFFFPTISTKLSASSVSTGDSVSDTAKLAGNSSDAGGTVTYSVYSDSSCSTKVADGGTVTVTNGSVPGSNSVNFPNAGTFYWQASYSGDGKNAPAKSPCTSEQLVVNAPSIHIVKTPDAAQVDAGDPIGFILTVSNSGLGDAKGVTLSDTLPVKSGLSWSIAGQGAGWGGTCAIAAGVLSCGPKTVPAGTTQAASTFTVHITSPTTAATGGVCPGGSGVVNNTGNVTTTNAGSGQSSASTCVAAPAIHIVKTADAAQVDAGDPIGFTLTVYNDGTGDAKGVTLSDTLPVKAGLSWSIAGQGTGWGGSCAIVAGVLSCGPVTVPAGTTQAASTFTVHITSPTTAATGGVCPGGSGVVNNTGNVTTTNAGSGQSSASTCVAAPAIHIVKTADAAQVDAGDPIGFTLTVYNDGTGDAKGVTLSDTLPVKAGLSWSIAGQGTGWGGSCAIVAGVLSCGPVTVPAGTTQAASTFTVHITSPTTAATGGTCPGGSGVVNNTGNVTTTNDGSDQSSASTCVAGPTVSITKTADHSAPVNAGGQIGFTVEIKNTGTGAATGVTLSDPLPAGSGSGVTWAIDTSVGTPAQFVLSGAKGSQTLSLASSTLPAGADYKVHITAQTSETECSVYDNTATLTTTNAGNPDPASAEESCAFRVDLAITKSGSPETQELGQGNISWTMVVTNNGPDTDTGVKVSDPMPAGNTYVSSTTTQGTCTGGAILTCNIGTMAAGAKVTITLITTPSQTGAQTNTAVVSGDKPETNLANNTATATVQITGAPFKLACVKVSKVTPRQLFVGRKTTLTIHLTQQGKAKSGVRVQIKGKKFKVVTKHSNAKGVIKQVVKIKRSGVLIFTPLTTGAVARCVGRIGVTGVFTPPVTG